MTHRADYVLTREYFQRYFWPEIYLYWQHSGGSGPMELKVGGVDVTSYLVYPTLQVEQRADTFVSTCSFQLYDEDGDLDIREKQEVTVEEGAVRYFAGIVANIDIENFADGPSKTIITVECQDFNIFVEEVIIDQLEEYGAAQDSSIIDDLFDKYLPEINSHTPGGAPPGYVQSLHIFAEISFLQISLREALDRIASEVDSVALEGYWYIDFYKYLHYFNVEDNIPAWFLSDTPDDVNSFSYFAAVRKSRQGAAITNRVMVAGSEMALFVQDYDSYDYYGKWFEGIVRDNTLITVSEITDHGNSLLAKWAYPNETFDISTRKTGLRAGMNVRFENTLFGTATRVNLVKNPSFEVNVTDEWTFAQDGAGGSAARDNAHYAIGAWACKLIASNAGNSEQQSNNIPVAVGETVTIQTRLYRATDIASEVVIYDATNALVRKTATPAETESFEFLTVSWVNATAGAVNVQIRIRNKEGDAAGEIWADACMAEINKGPYPISYIDGTVTYCEWDGVAHQSTSRRPPVYMIKQLTITWPENTATFALTLGGQVTGTALIKARLASDDIRAGLGPVEVGQLPISSRGWAHDIVFSATDNDTVEWAGGGTITTAEGYEYAIDAGNTGAMTADTINYIYLDIDTSETVLQVTELGPAVGKNIILIAVAYAVEAGKDAEFQVFGGRGIGVFIMADNIAANTITANEIAANTITAAEISVMTLTVNCWLRTAASPAPRIELTTTLLAGYSDAVTKQFYLDATTGKAYAGAGDVILDADGITIAAGNADLNTIKWVDGATVRGSLFTNAAGGIAHTWLNAGPTGVAAAYSILYLIAEPQAGALTYIHLYSRRPSDGNPGQIAFFVDAVQKMYVSCTQAWIEVQDSGSGVGTGTRISLDSAGTGFVNIDFNSVTSCQILTAGVSITNSLWIQSLGGSGNQDVGVDNTGKLYEPFVSDARFKQNVEPIRGALEAICSLRGVSFDWDNKRILEELDLDFGNDRQAGFIAQDVERHIPLAVSEPKGYKSVNEKKIVPYLVEAMKEVNARLDLLELA